MYWAWAQDAGGKVYTRIVPTTARALAWASEHGLTIMQVAPDEDVSKALLKLVNAKKDMQERQEMV